MYIYNPTSKIVFLNTFFSPTHSFYVIESQPPNPTPHNLDGTQFPPARYSSNSFNGQTRPFRFDFMMLNIFLFESFDLPVVNFLITAENLYNRLLRLRFPFGLLVLIGIKKQFQIFFMKHQVMKQVKPFVSILLIFWRSPITFCTYEHPVFRIRNRVSKPNC